MKDDPLIYNLEIQNVDIFFGLIIVVDYIIFVEFNCRITSEENPENNSTANT
jgi:hypothetical protein